MSVLFIGGDLVVKGGGILTDATGIECCCEEQGGPCPANCGSLPPVLTVSGAFTVMQGGSEVCCAQQFSVSRIGTQCFWASGGGQSPCGCSALQTLGSLRCIGSTQWELIIETAQSCWEAHFFRPNTNGQPQGSYAFGFVNTFSVCSGNVVVAGSASVL